MSDSTTPVRVRQTQELLTVAKVWRAFMQECDKLELSTPLAQQAPNFTTTEVRKDPFDNSESLYCEWRNDSGALIGTLVIHANGSVFAEYDLVQPHPKNTELFIESVCAFGSRDNLVTELKTLEAV